MNKSEKIVKANQPARQERGGNYSLFSEGSPVWFNQRGKVCSNWTSKSRIGDLNLIYDYFCIQGDYRLCVSISIEWKFRARLYYSPKITIKINCCLLQSYFDSVYSYE